MNIDLNKVQRFLDWLKTQLYLDTLVVNASRRVVKRGQVYRCNFGMGIGSEMQKERPAVIVQNSIGNLKSGNTIVIPITHDTSTLPCVAVITTQYEADGTTTKLDGQANASNIMCVSKSRLGTFWLIPVTDFQFFLRFQMDSRNAHLLAINNLALCDRINTAAQENKVFF